jgi:CysZ protein
MEEGASYNVHLPPSHHFLVNVPAPIPALPPERSAGDLFRGLAIPARAFFLIVRTPKLLALSVLCAVVTGLTLVGVGWGAWSLGQSLSSWLIAGDSGWQHAASVGLGVVFFIVLFAAGALTAPNLLLAPLQDPLSEATEAQCGDFTAPPFSLGGVVRGTIESLRHTLLRFVFMALGAVVLLPLNLIPVAGSVLYVVLSSTWSMFWLSVEHLSNPMARHLRPFREVVGALRKRLALSLGIGAALYVLLWIPVLNFFLMPVAVVAGTLLYRSLRQVGALPKSQ